MGGIRQEVEKIVFGAGYQNNKIERKYEQKHVGKEHLFKKFTTRDLIIEVAIAALELLLIFVIVILFERLRKERKCRNLNGKF